MGFKDQGDAAQHPGKTEYFSGTIQGDLLDIKPEDPSPLSNPMSEKQGVVTVPDGRVDGKCSMKKRRIEPL
jgi:hypothetical protein